MREHIISVLTKVIETNDYSLINKELSLEERDYFINNFETIFTEIQSTGAKILKDQIFENFYTKEEALNFQDNIVSLDDLKTSLVLYKLDDELKSEHLKKLNLGKFSYIVFDSIKPDDTRSKSELTSKFNDLDEKEKENLVSQISHEDLKLEIIKTISDDAFKYRIIYNLTREDLKVAALSLFQHDQYRIGIARDLKDDVLKEKAILEFTSDNYKSQLLASFKDETKKVELLSLISSDEEKGNVIFSLRDKSLIEKAILEISDDLYKIFIIELLNDHGKMIELLSKISPQAIAERIEMLYSTEEKIRLFSLIQDDNQRFKIINDLKESSKVSLLSVISSDEYKYDIVSKIKDEKLRVDSLSAISSDKYKYDIVSKIKDEKLRVDSLSVILDEYYIGRIVRHLSNPNFFAEGLNRIKDNREKFELLMGYQRFSKETLSVLINVFQWSKNDNQEEKIEKMSIVLNQYRNLDNELKESFSDYIFENLRELNKEKLLKIPEYIKMFSDSNSLEFSNLKNMLFPIILSSDDPAESFNEIEKIFIKNNLPIVGKLFLCFQTVYPAFEKEADNIISPGFDFSDDSRISPNLRLKAQTEDMKVAMRAARIEPTDANIRF